MGWLRKFFGGSGPSSTEVYLAPMRGFDQSVVGEANFQQALERIVGGKLESGARHQCEATLICETNNKHDPNAVAVFVSDRLVGYLPAQRAREYRASLTKILPDLPDACVKAKIVGGWKNEDGEGHFGVKLNFKMPIAQKRDTGNRK